MDVQGRARPRRWVFKIGRRERRLATAPHRMARLDATRHVRECCRLPMVLLLRRFLFALLITVTYSPLVSALAIAFVRQPVRATICSILGFIIAAAWGAVFSKHLVREDWRAARERITYRGWGDRPSDTAPKAARWDR